MEKERKAGELRGGGKAYLLEFDFQLLSFALSSGNGDTQQHNLPWAPLGRCLQPSAGV